MLYDMQLIPAAKRMVDELIPSDNQLHKREPSLIVTAADLLSLPEVVYT